MQGVLIPRETPKIEIVEHRLGGGKLLAPAHIYATDSRIIIIRNSIIGNYRKIKMINYDKITEVKLDRGFYFCRLHFGIQGEEMEIDESKTWVYGLNYNEAMNFVRFVNSYNENAKVAQNK